MPSSHRIMLVTQDPALRSVLAAVLGLDGHTLMIADACPDLDCSVQARRATILIFDEDLARDARDDCTARLLQQTDTIPVILLVARLTDAQQALSPIVCVAKADAAHVIASIIQAIRAGKPTDHR